MIPFTTVNEGDKAKMGLMSNSLMLNVQMLWKKYTLTPLTFHVLVNIYQFIGRVLAFFSKTRPFLWFSCRLKDHI